MPKPPLESKDFLLRWKGDWFHAEEYDNEGLPFAPCDGCPVDRACKCDDLIEDICLKALPPNARVRLLPPGDYERRIHEKEDG